MAAVRRTTLVGIVILVVAISVIAALAVPAWRHHATRGHLGDALKAADGAKLVVMEAATTHGGLDRLTPGDLAYDSSSTANPYVARISLNAGGRITITTRNTGATADPVLLLIPSEATSATTPLRWDCVMISGEASLAPDECHAGAPVSAASAPASASTAQD